MFNLINKLIRLYPFTNYYLGQGGIDMDIKTAWNLKNADEMQQIRQMAEGKFPIVQDNANLDDISAFFKGLADPTRLKIISLLWLEDLCMCEIVDALGAASSTINHHLKIMEKGNVIESRREGKFTIYHLNKEGLTFIIPHLTRNF